MMAALVGVAPAVAQPTKLQLDYPPASLLAHEEGVVRFSVLLDKTGKPKELLDRREQRISQSR